MYLMSPIQAMIGLAVSAVIETSWSYRLGYGSLVALPSGSTKPGVISNPNEDIWSHPYSSAELGLILATCILAIGINYSTIAIIGKFSAIGMQFMNQAKTVIVIGLNFVLFPVAMSFRSTVMLLAGMAGTISGGVWYANQQASKPKPAPKVEPAAPPPAAPFGDRV